MLSTKFSVSGRAGFPERRGGSGGLPFGRQQDAEVVLVGHGGQALQNIGEPGFGVVTVALGAFEHGVDDGGTLAGGFTADKQPVLFSNGSGADAVFGQIVVDFNLAAIHVKQQAIPQRQRVVDGAAKAALGQDFRALPQGEQFALEDFEHRGGLLAAHFGAAAGCGAAFTQRGFDLIEFGNDGHRAGGKALADFEGLVELATGVRPAGGKGDAVPAARPRGVAGIGVGLEVSLVIGQQFVEAGGLAAGVPLVEDVALDAASRAVDDPEVSGGGFAFAGIKVSDRSFVGLEVAGLEQSLVDQFVERFDGVGHDLVGVAEGVARDAHAVAAQQDVLGAVVGPVVAILRDSDVGGESRRGGQSERGRRGGFDGCGVGILLGDVDLAHGALDEDAAGLIVEPVGDEAIDQTVGFGVGGDLVAGEHGFLDGQMGEVARLARGALFGGAVLGGSFSRRSGVCGRGGGGLFFGIRAEEFELGGIDAFAAFVKEAGEHQVDLLAQELVFQKDPAEVGTQPVDLGEEFLFACGRHLRQT